MDSFDSLCTEEWPWSNLLHADFYGNTDQLYDVNNTNIWKGCDLIRDAPSDAPIDQLAPGSLGSDHINSFNINCLDDEFSTNLAHLDTEHLLQTPNKFQPRDDVLIASTPKFPKIEPSFTVPDVSVSDTSSATVSDFSNVAINDFNILHLPEPSEQEAAMIILEALSDPSTADLTHDLLSVADVESLLSTPPCSPGDECVVPASPPGLSYSPAPGSPPDMKHGPSPASESSPVTPDDEFIVHFPRKRKARATFGDAAHSSYTPRGKMPKATKKERKMLQNKNAATKYRIKKRDESVNVKQEYAQLESRNKTLKKKVDDLSTEIKYMKSLLNEVMLGKGVRFT